MKKWKIGQDVSNESLRTFDIALNGLTFEQFLYPIMGEGNHELQVISKSSILPLEQTDITQPTHYKDLFTKPKQGYTKLPTLQLFLGVWNHKYSNYFSAISPAVLQMLKNKEVIIVFNNFSEAWPHNKYNIPMAIEREAIKYGFPLENIVYISGNMYDTERYINESTYKTLNVINISYWHVMTHFNNSNFDHYKKPTTYKKIYACLMRKNRIHRQILLDTLENNNLLQHGLVSFPDVHEIDQPLQSVRFLDALEHIHRDCMFSITAETHHNSTVYTEKVIKPMLCRMPQLIIGNVNANRDLKLAGYKTYEDWFDLSWDSENDLEKRLHCAVEEIKSAVRRLYAFTDAEKHAWVNKNTEVLEHNYQQTVNNNACKNEVIRLLNALNTDPVKPDQ